MKYQTILLKFYFGLKGAVYYEAIAMVIFSCEDNRISYLTLYLHVVGGYVYETCPLRTKDHETRVLHLC